MQVNLPSNQSNDFADKLSLIEVVKFFQESWKTIAFFIALGITGATLYIWVVPKHYETRAQIKMAQIPVFNPDGISGPQSVSVEDPQALISRMILPSSYSEDIIRICGLADEKYASVLLSKKVKMSIVKSAGSIVDLRFISASKEISYACTVALFQHIKLTQENLIAPFIVEAIKNLEINQNRLVEIKKFLTSSHSDSERFSMILFLLNSNEISYLQDRILKLKEFIFLSEVRTTQLTAPIFLNNQPIKPQNHIIITISFLVGGFMGLLVALAKRVYRSKH